MKNRNMFWGAILVLVAASMIIGRSGWFFGLSIWAIALMVVCIGMLIRNLPRLNFYGILPPLAIIVIILQDNRWIPSFLRVNRWTLLAAAFLGAAGLTLLFRQRPPKRQTRVEQKSKTVYVEPDGEVHTGQPEVQTEENDDDNHPYAKVSFGSLSKYLHSTCLEDGQFQASFGAMDIYFDNAAISPNGAEIFLECNFASIKLYVPRHWNVLDKTNASLGGVKLNERFARPEEGAPTLTLRGNVQLGGVEVEYV